MLLLTLCPAGFGGTLLLEAEVLVLARAFELLLIVGLLGCVGVNTDKTGEGVSVLIVAALEIPPPFELSCLVYT